MKTIKYVFSVLLIIGLLATTALLFNSCTEASGLELELNSAGDAYTCVGFYKIYKKRPSCIGLTDVFYCALCGAFCGDLC